MTKRQLGMYMSFVQGATITWVWIQYDWKAGVTTLLFMWAGNIAASYWSRHD